jgi:predicted Zn-dependent protease
MTYFQLGKLDLARKYLEAARRIDPAHFSHPQMLLAEVLLRERKPREAADVLDEFLRYHPDYPESDKTRAAIERMRR